MTSSVLSTEDVIKRADLGGKVSPLDSGGLVEKIEERWQQATNVLEDCAAEMRELCGEHAVKPRILEFSTCNVPSAQK